MGKFKRKIEICLHPEKARLLEKYVKYNTSEKPQPNPQADRLKAALKRDRASLRQCMSAMPFDYMDDLDDFDWPDLILFCTIETCFCFYLLYHFSAKPMSEIFFTENAIMNMC